MQHAQMVTTVRRRARDQLVTAVIAAGPIAQSSRFHGAPATLPSCIVCGGSRSAPESVNWTVTPGLCPSRLD
jgi:hypothetical protein